MRSEYRTDEADPIAPVAIRHSVDELLDDGRLRERYDYLVYEFERDGVEAVARAYLDEPGKVLFFHLSPAGRPGERAAAPAFEAAVMAYLQRRYRRIDRLMEGGYRTIWTRDGG